MPNSRVLPWVLQSLIGLHGSLALGADVFRMPEGLDSLGSSEDSGEGSWPNTRYDSAM
ncbi:MAG: hypothetical protein ACKO3H_13795 [Verrucomicrobiota bacterium]